MCYVIYSLEDGHILTSVVMNSHQEAQDLRLALQDEAGTMLGALVATNDYQADNAHIRKMVARHQEAKS